ncbi:hypothetical protein [Thermaerobacter composti]|uniref:Uncharacterized protein n=1 Tax=Thermaerobacter composti TaxID=554949 RepID=A0ABZ0QSH8_9FIRM|nr:hypothetical protein [Thermaerobacter composti]WPD19582.1 hypothetical protein Q5761_02620 [Thermaerobacter composti]
MADERGKAHEAPRGAGEDESLGGQAGAAAWDAVQAQLHEMVDLARDLERHLEGLHGARAHRLRRLAEEVVERLRPGP